MPCIFCIAVFAIFAGAVTTLVLDQLESRLTSIATGPVSRSVDSASVAKFELSVTVPKSGLRASRSVPVSVTVYKKHRRIRIQVMTHDLTRAEAEAIEDLIAAALELNIIDRSDAHDEQKVREAFGEMDEVEAGEARSGEPGPVDARAEADEAETDDAEADEAETDDAEADEAERPTPHFRPSGPAKRS
jgi:hypothetical protein